MRQTFSILLDGREFVVDVEWTGKLEITHIDNDILLRCCHEPPGIFMIYSTTLTLPKEPRCQS